MTNAQTLDELRTRFPLEGTSWQTGDGGLPVLVVKNDQCDARVYPYGGHVASFRPQGDDEVLFMSPKSPFKLGKAIRGGVPVCFPWFGAKQGDKAAPPHGFVRTRPWQVTQLALQDNGRVLVDLVITSDEETRALWPYDFTLRHRVTLGDSLGMTLEVTNTSPGGIELEAALHTYFAVSDVAQVKVHGLSGTSYLDKVDSQQRKREGSEPVVLTGETDRVYLQTKSTCTIDDEAMTRRIRIEKTGSQATVLWNPWLVKAQAMVDLGGEAWKRFVCVETANCAPSPVILPPGAVHSMTARVHVDR